MSEQDVKKSLEAYGPVLTYRDLEAILGVSRKTLYLLIGRGQLTPRHLGPRRVGFSKREVVAQFGL